MRFPLALAVPAMLLLSPLPQWSQTAAWHSSIAKVSVKDSLNRKPGTAFVVALKEGAAYLVTLE